MSNTSSVHIKTDFDCKVYDYCQELGTAKADTYFNIELRKGEHELTFVFAEDESVSKTVNYIVEDADCDYRLIIELVEVLREKAIDYCGSKNFSAAFELYSLAAEKGFSKAQAGLGNLYFWGQGVEKNYDKALEWYTKAANQGNVLGQNNLGACYEYGKGVGKDLVKAAELYIKAAEQGYALGQYNVGRCYENGKGIEKDLIKATEWYTKAAEQGNENAQKALTDMKRNVKPIKYLFFDTETTGIPRFGMKGFTFQLPFYTETPNKSMPIKHGIRVPYRESDIKYTNSTYSTIKETSETTNLPRLVQLSWITTDEDYNTLSINNFIIYPNDFTIPEDATNIHGITTDIAKEKGKPLEMVLGKFMNDFNLANTIVGHNIDFDKSIIGAELVRLGQKDTMNTKASLCTMKTSTQLCMIPSKYGYKWPTLQELHSYLFGCEFEDAHNSMSDVKATLKCFKEMKKLGWI